MVQVKANQPSLFEIVSATAGKDAPTDTATSRDTVRSRQEDRTVEVFPVGEALAETEWQPFIKTIVRVTRYTLLRTTATGLWRDRGEVAHYVSSAEGLPATAWATVIRGCAFRRSRAPKPMRWRAAVPTDRGQLRWSAVRFMPPLTGGCIVGVGEGLVQVS